MDIKIKTTYSKKGSSPFALQPTKSRANLSAVQLPPMAGGLPPLPATAGTKVRKAYPKYSSGVAALPAATSAAFAYARDISALDTLYNSTNSWSLGSGANGSVCTCAKRATGELFALKTMPPDEGEPGEDALERLLADVDMQRSLDHPSIARVLDVFVDRKACEVSFVMPLCSGGTVVQYLRRHPCISEGAKATLVHKMLSAVHYCHQHGVMHRDIKLENFVFDSEAEDAELKLIDFGMATRVRPGDETQSVGFTTLLYTAPEMHWIWHKELTKRGRRDPRSDVTYDSAIDVWAVGIIAYQLLCGTLPFGLEEDPSEDEEMLVDRIAFEPLCFPARPPSAPPANALAVEVGVPAAAAGAELSLEAEVVVAPPPPSPLSEPARAFCKALLERDPSLRPNAEAAMAHEWLAGASRLRTGAEERGVVAADPAELARHEELVCSLSAFAEAGLLKRHAYHAAAYTAPSSAERVKELRKAFIEADANDSGTLSLAEFKAVMQRYPDAGQGLDPDKLFAAVDVGGRGEIEWRWFLAATLIPAGTRPAAPKGKPTGKPRSFHASGRTSRTAPLAGTNTGAAAGTAGRGWLADGHPPTLIDTFLLLDRDGDGYIDAHDLAALFAGSADPAARTLGPKQIQKMLQHALGSKRAVERLALEDFRAVMLRPTSKLSGQLNAVQRGGGGRDSQADRQLEAAYGVAGLTTKSPAPSSSKQNAIVAAGIYGAPPQQRGPATAASRRRRPPALKPLDDTHATSKSRS